MAIIYTNQSSGYARKNNKKMKNISANQLAQYKEDLKKKVLDTAIEMENNI